MQWPMCFASPGPKHRPAWQTMRPRSAGEIVVDSVTESSWMLESSCRDSSVCGTTVERSRDFRRRSANVGISLRRDAVCAFLVNPTRNRSAAPRANLVSTVACHHPPGLPFRITTESRLCEASRYLVSAERDDYIQGLWQTVNRVDRVRHSSLNDFEFFALRSPS